MLVQTRWEWTMSFQWFKFFLELRYLIFMLCKAKSVYVRVCVCVCFGGAGHEHLSDVYRVGGLQGHCSATLSLLFLPLVREDACYEATVLTKVTFLKWLFLVSVIVLPFGSVAAVLGASYPLLPIFDKYSGMNTIVDYLKNTSICREYLQWKAFLLFTSFLEKILQHHLLRSSQWHIEAWRWATCIV